MTAQRDTRWPDEHPPHRTDWLYVCLCISAWGSVFAAVMAWVSYFRCPTC